MSDARVPPPRAPRARALRDQALRDQALETWYAARTAAGAPPTDERVARVRAELAASDAVLVHVVDETTGRVVGMALAEPFRRDGGRGEEVAGAGHVSMVFVHPAQQGRGVGTRLVTRLLDRSPWSSLSLWTRDTNHAARRLYERSGFGLTPDRGSTPAGEATSRWERSAPHRASQAAYASKV